MDVSGLIRTVKESRGYEGQIVHIEDIATKDPQFSPVEMNPLMKHALGQMGIEQLYSHQAEAVEKARNGENIVLSTSTASGKTMCYMLPIFEKMLEDPFATALYISPLNALVNDQLQTFLDFSEHMHLKVKIDRFTGSMSKAEKDAVK